MDNDRRNQEAPIVPKMVLFWLVIVIAAGILFIGGRFLAAPAAGAEGFGVPLPRSDAYAYLAAKGIRDVVSGLLLIDMGCQRRVLGIFILAAILIPVGDFLTSYPWRYGTLYDRDRRHPLAQTGHRPAHTRPPLKAGWKWVSISPLPMQCFPLRLVDDWRCVHAIAVQPRRVAGQIVIGDDAFREVMTNERLLRKPQILSRRASVNEIGMPEQPVAGLREEETRLESSGPLSGCTSSKAIVLQLSDRGHLKMRVKSSPGVAIVGSEAFWRDSNGPLRKPR